MAKVDEGFTIKLPKKGSNKMLLPIVAMLAFLFVSIAFGMYVYEPVQDVASTKPVVSMTSEVNKTAVNQTSNNIFAVAVPESKENNVLLEKNSSSGTAIENTNLSAVQESSTKNSVQEFKQVLNFDFDSTEIKSYDDQALRKFLADNQDKKLKIIIDGHTDSIGNEEYNQDLSERRANSVQQELMTMTAPQSDITKKITGYGETKPVDTNDSPEGRANNRRVELTIIVLP